MQQNKEHERDDRKTFDNAAERRLRTRLFAEQNEVDCRCFEEWNQFWTNTFQLKIQTLSGNLI